MELVEREWNRHTEPGGLLTLQTRLTRLKKSLKLWNKEVVGNLHANPFAAEREVVTAQEAFEPLPNPVSRSQVNKSIAQYILLLKMEEEFWRQKASIRWLKDGDRNTKFYQSWVKQKRARLHIHGIHEGNQFISDDSEVRNSAVRFFQNLLAPEALNLVEPDLSLIHQLPDSTNFERLMPNQRPRK